MTDYKNIHGKRVKFFTSDLDNAQAEGQIFYSSTDATTSAVGAFNFKTAVSSAAWSSGAPLATARYNQASGSTPTTAGVTFGGFVTPGPGPAHADTNVTEEYDGTGWASGGNMNTARSQFNGFGTQTTAVGAGGYINGSGDTALVEEYNGSTWTEVTNIPAARRGQAGFGTLTAGVIVAGVPNSNATLEYDGTNWTAGNNIGTGMDRTGGAGAGILTAGIVASGDTTESFTYDGTNWTDVGTTNSPHDGGHDTGVQTAAVITSGFPPPGSGVVTATELYDGTSFTTSATVATGRYGASRGGASGTTAFIAGGDVNPGTQSITEEFNITVNTVTQGAWTAGGNCSNAVTRTTGAGTQTAGLKMGGNPGTTDQVEEYDGSSWSEGGDLGTARYSGVGCGTQTAGLLFGGYVPSSGTPIDQRARGETEEYNGTSWTESGDLNLGRRQAGGFGIQTAAVCAGGNGAPNSPGIFGEVEEYNGSSWTEVTNLPTTTRQATGAGILTAGLITGGCDQPGTTTRAETYEYDGTSWTDGGDLNTKRQNTAGNGTQTVALIAGGEEPSPGVVKCEGYDGTTWATFPNMANGRYNHGSATNASQTTSLQFTSPGDTDATEEFTAGTTALNLKTITDS